MPLFAYKAVQTDGSMTQGQLEAGGRLEAMNAMEGRGLTPLQLAEVHSTSPNTGSTGSRSWRRNRVTFGQLEDFTRSLSSLLTAGVPLSRALTILYQEAASPAAGRTWRDVHDLVIDGVSLADAMGRAPTVFPRVYVAMVESGETGGFLDVVLGQIADFQSRDKELRANVLSALLYPAVLLVLALAVLVFLLIFFIPRFEVLFEGFDAALPPLTQAIVSTSEILRRYGLILLGGGVVALHMGRTWLTSDAGRRGWENLLLHTPLVGSLTGKLAMARFCRMLGTLLGAGVPLLNGLSVARRSLGFQTLIDLVAEAAERVKQGESLANSLADCRTLFPGSTLEMIAVGEESSRLDQELVRLAETTERAIDRQLKTTVALAEPLMLFLIAGFIGIIFVGMVIPIFSIQDYIQ